MDKEKPLTIEPAASLAKLRADGRNVAAYARARNIPPGTLARIMGGSYPYTDNPLSAYQRVLRQLKVDGYLVEFPRQEKAA